MFSLYHFWVSVSMNLLTTVEKNTAFDLKLLALRLPRWLDGKESTCQYR